METPVRIRRMPLVILVVAVCLASVVVGWFFGGLAGAGYAFAPSSPLGLKVPGWYVGRAGVLAGAFGGVLAGLVWCEAVVRRAMHRESTDGVALAGGGWGVLVGVLTTVAVHGTLLWVARSVDWPIQREQIEYFGLIGLTCGIVAGGLLGLLSGAACGWAVKRARLREPSIIVSPPASE